jgi:hypothetical protein
MLPASMLGDYSTSASSTPYCFLHRTDLLGNLFLTTSLLDLPLLLFLDHHTGHPTRHDARIPLYACIFDALRIFSSPFRSIGSLLPIGHHSTSLRSAIPKTSRLPSRFVFFGLMCMLFDLPIALRLHHDLSKVDVPTPHSGACESWVPLGPHRPGSRPSPTSGSGQLDNTSPVSGPN